VFMMVILLEKPIDSRTTRRWFPPWIGSAHPQGQAGCSAAAHGPRVDA
jgi:hypothetical protein